MSSALLQVDEASVRFGGLRALDGVSLQVRSGGISAIIGPNGAGKTTMFNLVTGVVRPTGGKVTFDGVDITKLPTHRIARLGVARTFQTPELSGDMTVLENVLVGAGEQQHVPNMFHILGTPKARREERRLQEIAWAELQAVGLVRHAHEPASIQPLGRRRMLEIARALAGRPRLLLLDEPASGLNTVEADQLGRTLRDLTSRGVTTLLVEHNVPFVMALAEHVTVFHHGRVLASGAAADVRRDATVIEAYLGTRRQSR